MKISEHCYLVSGLAVDPPWAVNAGFIVGENKTIIVDTGYNYLSAQTIFGYAHSVNPDNEFIVVITEPHFDHTGGSCFFEEKGIEIYAFPGVGRTENEFKENIIEFNNIIPNEIRRRNNESEIFFYNTRIANPNKQILHNEKIDAGGIVINVYHTPGHTPFNITLFEPGERVLFCGDTIVTGYMPNLEAGNISCWDKWLMSLDLISDLNPEVIVTGHGYHITGPENIENEIDKIRRILESAIKDKVAPTLKK